MIEFPIDESSFSRLRSNSGGSGRRGSDCSVSAMSKSSARITMKQQPMEFNIYKQVNKALPKPGIFVSGSATGRGALPRMTKKTLKVKDGLSGLSINVDASPIGSNSGSKFEMDQLNKQST